MDLKVIYKNARCAVLEIEDGGTYEASRMYRIYLNGEFIRETGKAVTSIYNLKPDTGYQVEARSGDSLVFKTSFTTDSEYVTLDVRDFGANETYLHNRLPRSWRQNSADNLPFSAPAAIPGRLCWHPAASRSDFWK